MEKIKLSNGLDIPNIGYGTCEIQNKKNISEAIDCGYRLIDTASHYYNEKIVGQAINESKIDREEIVVSTKLWYSDMGYESALQAFERSLDELQLSYIDLYLIHWPAAEPKYTEWKQVNIETWRALEKIYLSGKVKGIGTCNFMKKHLAELLPYCEVKPMINQIESHPGFYQTETVDFCKNQGIDLMAWGPLGTGGILDNDLINELATKYHKTAAQICLRWNLQNGFIVIPKTQSRNRMKENSDIFDFNISSNDMSKLNNLPFCGGIGAIVQ